MTRSTSPIGIGESEFSTYGLNEPTEHRNRQHEIPMLGDDNFSEPRALQGNDFDEMVASFLANTLPFQAAPAGGARPEPAPMIPPNFLMSHRYSGNGARSP